jgi:ankyrin repeat protein
MNGEVAEGTTLLRWENVIFQAEISDFGAADIELPETGIGGTVVTRARSSKIPNDCILLSDGDDVVWMETIAHNDPKVKAIIISEEEVDYLQERWGSNEFSVPVIVVYGVDHQILLLEGSIWGTVASALHISTEALAAGEFLAAAMRNDMRAMQVLLANGVDVNTTDERLRNGFQLAVLRGNFAVNAEQHKDVLGSLIKSGVDINHSDMTGKTALHHAANNRNFHALKVSLVAGADTQLPDEKEVSCLELVCMQGWAEAAQCLCEAGASMTAQPRLEAKLYRSAVFSNNCALVSVLYGHRALWLRSRAAREDANDGRRVQLEIDIDLENDGSLLLYAIKFRLKSMVDAVLSEYKDMYGKHFTIADVNKKTVEGRTALMEACIWGNSDLVRTLMRYTQGWRTPWVYGGLTPCNLGLVDNTGKTALVHAVLKGMR